MLAIFVLVLVAVVAIRLLVGLVVGFVSAVLWILVAVAFVAAGLWARSTLKSTKRRRGVKQPSSSPTELAAAPGEDPVLVVLRRISEQLREQATADGARVPSQTSTRPARSRAPLSTSAVSCGQQLVA